jgi:glycosyltransferase involved in cell wall biosynthesis
MTMRILFLSRWYPFPYDNGSKIRIWNLLKVLRAEHEVAFVSFAAEAVPAPALAAMQALCDAVHVVPYHGFRPGSLRARLGFFSPMPRSVIDTFSPEMSAAVEEVAASWKPDLVIASQIDMLRYALAVKNVGRVLEELELAVLYEAYQHEARGAARLRKGLTWWKLDRYLRQTLPAFDLVTVVSPREQELARRVCPQRTPVQIVPNGADLTALAQVAAPPQPGTLIYSGALSFSANYDAVHYFLRDIFPLILAQAPDTRLFITGSTQGVAIDQLPQMPNVHFTGYLESVWPAVAASWVSVVPLRLGGGTRLKVIESLALGTPVVATAKGAEGLDLTAGAEIAVADTPQHFAEQVLALLRDADLRHRFSARGRHAVRRYDWAVIGRNLNGLLAGVAPRRQLQALASEQRGS